MMRSICQLLLLILGGAAPLTGFSAPQLAADGASLYQHGVLPSGRPVSARREGSATLTGAEAACSNCHRRSGLGEIEGSIKIPPIAGPYLFHARASSRDELDVPFLDNMRMDRDPYTPDALARAIRDGIGIDGKPLNYLMPRYALSDTDMTALTDYLKQMQPLTTRGVTGATLELATIVTPDAAPERRRGMESVLAQYFADQNAYALAQVPTTQRTLLMKSLAKRRWHLHEWTLTGVPSSWAEQLDRHLAQEPVYAVISGLGGENWQPVHEFCERAALPCLFPNLDLPVVAEQDVYSLYFSKGVLLEAELLGKQIAVDNQAHSAGRVLQIFRPDDVGAAAAARLEGVLAGSGIHSLKLALRSSHGSSLKDLVQSVRPSDVLVLWLRSADIGALADLPPRGSGVFASGLMGGLENSPLPPAWRPVTRMTYPAQLPQKRLIGSEFALGWMKRYRIPVYDPQVQVNTYVACGLLMETLTRMPGAFTSDYLIERFEGMLEHQLVSGYFPSLALAPNERFASKGGYIVHFAAPTGTALMSDTDWRVP